MSDISLSKAVRANLLSLQNTAEMMNKTQSRLATGNKVNSALDNPSNFFTAASLNSRAADMSNLLDSMASGIKVIEAANNGLTALTKNLESMQSTLRQARQDKSFQTKSFEVTENSVITFGGGRFDLDSVIKLADAEAKAGVNASLTSIGSTAYVGPVSTESSAAGAGARTVISGLSGIPANSEISVAGVDINVGTYANAEELAANIQAALDADDNVAGQYRVMAGAAGSPNANKIIIETVDTDAPAAEVVFGTGTTEAVKGSVTFNFAELPNQITVGNQTINTGTDLASFVANLEAGAKAGGYEVKVDDDLNITLTATDFGVAAPQVNGIVPSSGTAATTTFNINLASASTFTVGGQSVTLDGAASTGERSSATYQIDLTQATPTTITVDGTEIEIPAASGDAEADALVVEGLINAELTGFTATVSDTGEVVLLADAVGATPAPAITSGTSATGQTVAAATVVTTGANAQTTSATYSIDINATDKTVIRIDGTDVELPAATGVAQDDADAFEAAINLALTGLGYTAEVTDTGVLTITADTAGVSTAPTIESSTAAQTVTAGSETLGDGTSTPTVATFSISIAESDATRISVGGVDVEIPAATGVAADDALAAEAAINAQLTAANADFTATVATDGTVTLTGTTNAAVSAPVISTAAASQAMSAPTATTTGAAATTHSVSYSLDLTGTSATTINVGGTEVTIPAATGDADDDAAAAEAAIQDALDGLTPAYTASVANDGTVTLTANAAGVSTPPAITDGASRSGQTVAAASATTTGSAATTGETPATAQTKIEQALTAANITGFTVSVNNAGEVSIIAATAGATNAVQVAGTGATDVTPVNGTAASSGPVVTPTVVGASSETIDAATDNFTVSYDDKSANISIAGLKLGASPLDRVNWQADTIESINAQLEGQGVKGVEAKFDDNGQLTLVSKTAEAETLAISGRDATRLFGDDTVSIGSPTETGLNATKPTDKFVEFINKKFGGQVRASNDNGKLRIENLSTQELNIGVDTNGNGAINSVKIDGNSVRANLSKQFNELRDQLDKLADDASFNGINLLRGDKLKITFNESGTSSIDIQAKDKDGNVRGINASNLSIDSLVAEDLDTDEAIDAFLAKLSSALTELRSQASSFGSNLSSVENRQSFTKNMINTLETGAANLTLADTNEEAANLLALQTRQQLSSSALSMASQQDQAVLQLLR